MSENLQLIGFLLIVSFLGILLSVLENKNKKKVKTSFQKNFFDWIVYVLAWIGAPCFIVSFRNGYRPKKEDNNSWEKERRINLYILIDVCFVAILLFLLKSFLEEPSVFCLVFVFVLIFALYFFNLQTKLYEKHIESKSYILKKK